MNHRLTCDDVFDHLTRAPFPAGEDSDQLVDEHLSICHDCRKMAEALRPATDLFQEVLSSEQRRSLPAYRGQLATITRDESGIDRAFARPLSVSGGAWQPVVSNGPLRHQPWYFLPALGLTILLMVAVLQGPGAHDSIGDGLRSNPRAALRASGPDQAMTCLLAGFSLPPDCLPRSIVGPIRPKPIDVEVVKTPKEDSQHLLTCLSCHETVQVAAASQACCTNCHSASVGTKPAKKLFPRLATSCAGCHEASLGRGTGISG